MLPRVTLISCAALILFMAHTSHAAPVVQKRGFGDIEQVCDDDALTGFGDFGDLADELDGDDFDDFTKRDEDHVAGAGGHVGPVHAGGGAVNNPDDGAIGDSELFRFAHDLIERDGDGIVRTGAGIGLGETVTKRDGDHVAGAGGYVGPVHAGGGAVNEPDEGSIHDYDFLGIIPELAAVFKRDGDGIVHTGAGIGVGDFIKRDGDGIVNGGAGIGLGGSFTKRDGDGIVHTGAGIGLGDD